MSKKNKPRREVFRCRYCGEPTKVDPRMRNTRLARFPHSPARQKWPPMCDLHNRTKAILNRIKAEGK